MVLRRPSTVRIEARSLEPCEVIEALSEFEEFESSSIVCVQRGIDGTVMVTFKDSTAADSLVEMDCIEIKGIPCLVSYVDSKKIYVKVHYLPCEVADQCVRDKLSEFGHVFFVRRDKYLLHPLIENGTRTVTMTVKRNIPSFLTIGECEAKIYYRDQQKTCRLCGREGHFSKNCPEVKCYGCGDYGHVASNCDQDLYCDYCFESSHLESRCPWKLEDEEKRREEKRKKSVENLESQERQLHEDQTNEPVQQEPNQPQQEQQQGHQQQNAANQQKDHQHEQERAITDLVEETLEKDEQQRAKGNLEPVNIFHLDVLTQDIDDASAELNAMLSEPMDFAAAATKRKKDKGKITEKEKKKKKNGDQV